MDPGSGRQPITPPAGEWKLSSSRAIGQTGTVSKRRRTKPRPRPTPPAPERPALALVPTSSDSMPTAEPRPRTPEPVNPEQVQHLVGIIATGGLDEHLATISAAIGQRHRHLLRAESNQAAARINLGDRISLNHTIRPLYLHGATGTVIDWAGQRAIVQLDNPIGRFTTGEVRCPPLGLDRLPT